MRHSALDESSGGSGPAFREAARFLPSCLGISTRGRIRPRLARRLQRRSNAARDTTSGPTRPLPARLVRSRRAGGRVRRNAGPRGPLCAGIAEAASVGCGEARRAPCRGRAGWRESRAAPPRGRSGAGALPMAQPSHGTILYIEEILADPAAHASVRTFGTSATRPRLRDAQAACALAARRPFACPVMRVRPTRAGSMR